MFLSSYLGFAEGIKFNSQACQDQFVYSILYNLLGQKNSGYYLEIGAGEPKIINNTYTLEKSLNWKGISIDISKELKFMWDGERSNPFLLADATTVNYSKILENFPKTIDYLSLDIDGYYDVVLNEVIKSNKEFKIITIEHDAYRYGDVYRNKERDVLLRLGYHLLCADVCHNSYSFEDWWINPNFFEPSIMEKISLLDLNNQDCNLIIQKLNDLILSL